jgi:hypothetical protein
LLAVAGCSGSSDSEEYPVIEPTPPARQHPVTTPSGAVVTLPALPTVYETDPSPTCERQLATFHDGKDPARRPVVIPPAPGLRAVAITKYTTRLEWSFRDLPADCRPVSVLVSVKNGSHPGATPTTERVRVDGTTGRTEISYPDFLPPPNVAIASTTRGEGAGAARCRC